MLDPLRRLACLVAWDEQLGRRPTPRQPRPAGSSYRTLDIRVNPHVLFEKLWVRAVVYREMAIYRAVTWPVLPRESLRRATKTSASAGTGLDVTHPQGFVVGQGCTRVDGRIESPVEGDLLFSNKSFPKALRRGEFVSGRSCSMRVPTSSLVKPLSGPRAHFGVGRGFQVGCLKLRGLFLPLHLVFITAQWVGTQGKVWRAGPAALPVSARPFRWAVRSTDRANRIDCCSCPSASLRFSAAGRSFSASR